jgi:D-arabinose 1-dehydrogenase-like Zn-dependent alcohol dehydrogenase
VIGLCAKHNITPHIKVVPVHELNGIYEMLDRR